MSRSGALIRPTGSIFWELRGAWATGRRVSLTLERGDERIEGQVHRVAATDAFVEVAGKHVPGDTILAVHSPSLLGDSDADPLRISPRRWHGPARRVLPQTEELPVVDPAPPDREKGRGERDA